LKEKEMTLKGRGEGSDVQASEQMKNLRIAKRKSQNFKVH